ncbi:MAG: bifunctional diaminohydroxyphosphoribosylaminopyrimidine deaminase/5-amino-6-(5-phosphoribosylamino)uracil reductase RibD, partial [Candidatus Omnitrophica bacterium]|nr:bifunctional diaminohydroxyphosphoribosylaminopyrimidine deaminase/5-amino-6-(5-phosphoribosylamino)uracil reductase RibD [Candidatus Omnitrophota bacterium]
MAQNRSQDEFFMRLALEAAKRGEGLTHPNPLVGAALVRNGRVIGVGAHERFGGPHAEVNAISRASGSSAGATLYVTLEPCAHFGKTPPCADFILRHKIGKVVIATKDPNPRVNGRGMQKLKKAGVKVVTGVLEKEARELNKDLSFWARTGRPYTVAKVGQSL